MVSNDVTGSYAWRWLTAKVSGPISGGAVLGLNPDGQLHTAGRKIQRRATAVNTTITLQDEVIAVTDTSAARTITLLSAATAGAGATYTVKDESGGAATNNITIARAGSDTIEGVTSKVINSNFGSIRVLSTGTGWVVIGGSANSSDAFLLARANHTGTQSADTLTDGTTNKAFLATERTKLTGIATAATANSAESAAATASQLALRDANANLVADAFIPSATSTVTAAGTTTLTVNSTEVQIFTGTTTQIVSLATTGYTQGRPTTFINLSTGVVTINASGGALVKALPAGETVVLEANTATPTTAAHWSIVGGTPGAGGGGGASSYVYTTNVGDGTAGPFTITHNFGSDSILVDVWKNSGAGLTAAPVNTRINVSPTKVNTNSFTITPSEAWGTNEFRVIVVLVTAATAPSPVAQLPISGTYAARPSAGTSGRFYFCTDNGNTYLDNGTTWDLTSVAGTGIAGAEPPSSGWSTTTLGSATVAADKGGRLFTAPVDATSTLRMEYRTLSPASNYTCTAYIETDAEAANYSITGLALRNSGGNLLIQFGLAYNNGWFFRVTKYSAPATYNSDYKSPILAAMPYGPPCWLRIRDNATNRFFEYSYNGIDFFTFYSVGRTDYFTPDQIGWVVCGVASGTSSAHARLRSWSIV